MQRNDHLPFHQAGSSTSATTEGIEGCFQEHDFELSMEIDDQQMSALHILCANPFLGTGDAIHAYLTSAPGASNVNDGTEMTGLHILCSLPHQETSGSDAICAYLTLAPGDAYEYVQDGTGRTGLYILCSLPHQDTSTSDAIRTYLQLVSEAVASL